MVWCLHGRLETGDRFAIFGLAAFGDAQPVFGLGKLALGPGLLRFAFEGLGRGSSISTCSSPPLARRWPPAAR